MSKFTKNSPVSAIVNAVVSAIHAANSASGTIARGAVALAMLPDAEASKACGMLMAGVREAGLTGAGYDSNIRRIFRAAPSDLDAVWEACEAMPQWPSMQWLFREFPEAFPTKGDGRGKRAAPATNSGAAADPVIDGSVPGTLRAFIDTLTGMNAKINTIGLTAADVEKAREPMLQCIAVLQAAKTAQDAKAKAETK
jgi:hypothetical protein